MIITRKALPRRTVLRGIGATVALPLLDGMVPALTALSRTAARPIQRFGWCTSRTAWSSTSGPRRWTARRSSSRRFSSR